MGWVKPKFGGRVADGDYKAGRGTRGEGRRKEECKLESQIGHQWMDWYFWQPVVVIMGAALGVDEVMAAASQIVTQDEWHVALDGF